MRRVSVKISEELNKQLTEFLSKHRWVSSSKSRFIEDVLRDVLYGELKRKRPYKRRQQKATNV